MTFAASSWHPLSWCGKRRSGTTGRAPYGRELDLWRAGTSRGTRCCRRCGTRCEIVDRAYRLLAVCISVAGLALQLLDVMRDLANSGMTMLVVRERGWDSQVCCYNVAYAQRSTRARGAVHHL